MKRILITLTTITLIAATAAMAGEGKDNREGKGPREGRPAAVGKLPLVPAPLLQKLNLSPEQKTKYDSLAAEFDKARGHWLAANPADEKLRSDIKAAHQGGDKKQAQELRAKAREQHKPLMDLRKTYMNQVVAILTPEQKTTLEESRRNFRDKADKAGKRRD